MQKGGPHREDCHTGHGGEGEGFSDLFVTQEEERKVEKKQKDSQGSSTQVGKDNGDPGDSPIDHLIGDKENRYEKLTKLYKESIFSS